MGKASTMPRVVGTQWQTTLNWTRTVGCKYSYISVAIALVMEWPACIRIALHVLDCVLEQQGTRVASLRCQARSELVLLT